jgi:hypothetical protein
MKREVYAPVGPYLYEGTLQETLDILQEWNQQFFEYKDLTLEYDDAGCCYLRLWGTRLETDVEYKLRVIREQSINDREQAEYERLKKKFG